MQNRYCGDVGDFGKYGLLRYLSGAYGRDQWPHLRLGVFWYLVPNEDRTADGRHTNYLEDTRNNRNRFRACDPELWDKLKKIVDDKDRCVCRIREEKVLGSDSLFYEEVLGWPCELKALSAKGRQQRKLLRGEWAKRGQDTLKDCSIVLIDPDNGLEVKSVGRYEAKGPKYAFYDEIVPCYQRGQSLIIYQHLNLQEEAGQQIETRRKEFQARTGATDPIALRFHRGTGRVFFIVPGADQRQTEILRRRVLDFVSSAWKSHFSLHE